MNIVYIDYKWMKNALRVPLTPPQKSLLLSEYALKDFQLVNQSGEAIRLRLDNVNLDDYGTHEAIFVITPEDEEGEWTAILCSDTELSEKFYNAGLVIRGKDSEKTITRYQKESLSIAGLWFLVNREVLKKYKTVLRIGKRRHLIQEMGADLSASYQQKPIKIADGVSYIWEYENPRSFNRHCEAWGVRGHYRHYKSGKVIFIQPYTKGSGRLKNSLYEL